MSLNPYVTLISSLPRHDALFADQQIPLSRIKLKQRLQLLSHQHRQQLQWIEQIMHWDSWPPALPHDQVVARIRHALGYIEDNDVRELMHEKLDLRTVMGALRLRQVQPQQPPTGDWAVSRYRDVIARHWQEDDFHLGKAFPWLLTALALMREQQILKLEKLLMNQAWQTLHRHQPEDEFGFMAVVQYVMKWHLVERWSRNHSEEAKQRFHTLIQSTLNTAGYRPNEQQ